MKTAQSADEPDHVLGARLVKEGLVDERAVREALRRKVELTIFEVLKWKDGEFAFNREGENEPSATEGAVEFDAQDVLLNVLKQIDEDARGRAAPARSGSTAPAPGKRTSPICPTAPPSPRTSPRSRA